MIKKPGSKFECKNYKLINFPPKSQIRRRRKALAPHHQFISIPPTQLYLPAMSSNPKKKRPRQKHQKVVVTFDEDERAEYLTGFRKRKAQRREQAIVEMVEKARKDKLEERADRREKKAEMAASSGNNLTMEDNQSSDDEDAVEQVSFADDFSKERFGATNVTVTTVVGFDGEDSDDDVDALREKLAARQKTNKKRNLLNEEKRLAKAMDAKVKKMKEILLKSKRQKKKSKRSKQASGKKEKGKRR